jgi:tRNA threonylcarbamoyladenosine biosynthesis protein TsaE
VTPSPAQLAARTRSVDETRSLAAALAGLTQAGDLILLAGDLGAGKTAFVQGFGRALGVDEPITSPTFTLAQRYEGARVVHHLDVYRLEQLREVLDLGLAELLDEGGVVLVEWGDAVAPVVPADYLEVRLAYGDADDERRLTFRPVGTRWSARQRSLAEAVSPWTEVASTSPAPAPTPTSSTPASEAAEGGS